MFGVSVTDQINGWEQLIKKLKAKSKLNKGRIMKSIKLQLNSEIHTAEIERALNLTSHVWESNADMSIVDMCNHLEAIGNIVDGTRTFTDFCNETNLSNPKGLN